MLLTDKQTSHLLGFLGYGNPFGKLWFIGVEEAGEGEENLRKRLGFDIIEDSKSAHVKLGILNHHTGKRKIQKTWRGMCIIALKVGRSTYGIEQIRRYQAEELGRFNKNTFLAELYPIPKSRTGRWPYLGIIPGFVSENHYRESVLQDRLVKLRDLVETGSPSLIVAYGKTCWKEFKLLFPGRAFKATECGRFEISQGAPRILLTPHLTAREMNVGIYVLAELASQPEA